MKYHLLQSFYKKVIEELHSLSTFGVIFHMYKIYTLLFLSFISVSGWAQTEIVEIDANDNFLLSTDIDTAFVLTNVNVFKDPRLDILKTRPELMARNRIKEELEEKRNEKLGVNNVKNYSAINRGKKQVTGSIVTRKGFRIVIYTGSDRTEAMNMKRKFMSRYSGTRSYFSYVSPYFKVRVGDFAEKTSAYNFLKQLKSAGFTNAFVVPDIVTIKDINVR